MGSYVQGSLTKNERVIYEGKVSIASLLPLILLGLVMLFASGIGVIFLIMAAIKYFTLEMAITNKRVIAKHGMIRRSTVEINLQRIESIQVHQSILGRIFNYGSIIVAGAGSPQAPVPGISNPMEFRRAFVEAQEDMTSTAEATGGTAVLAT